MKHPDYVWMFHNWYNIDWWTDSTNINCTQDQMKEILRFQFVLDHYPRINEEDKNKTNVGGIVSERVHV